MINPARLPVAIGTATILMFLPLGYAASPSAEIYHDDLAAADASRIIIAGDQTVGSNIAQEPTPIFSPDGKSLLYAIRPDTGAVRQLIIAELPGLQARQTLALQFDCQKTAWSPDQKRVLYQDSHGNLHVIDLSGRSEVALPLPDGKFSGYDARPVWRTPELVSFVVARSGANWIDDLNLDDLTVRRRNVASGKEMHEEFQRLFAFGGAHPRAIVYGGAPPEETANAGINVNEAYLMVANRDGSYARLLRKGIGSNTTLSVSRDLRHIVVFGGDSVTLLYLGVRPKPSMLFAVGLGTSHVSADKRADYELYRQLRIPFRANVYAPATNPLNGKQVGPDRNHFKGRIEVVRWGSDSAVTRPTLELEAFGDGDVAADFRSDSEAKHFGNRQFSFGDEWQILRQTDDRTASASSSVNSSSAATHSPSPEDQSNLQNSSAAQTPHVSPFDSEAAQDKITERQPIAADDFCARDVESFLNAVKRKDFREALAKVSSRAKGNDQAFKQLRQFLTADKRLKDVRAFRVLTHRNDSDVSRLVAEVTSSSNQTNRVTFTLWHEVEEEEREGCDIMRIEADSTYSSPAIATAQGSTASIESLLIGKWQGSRIMTAFLPDHTHNRDGLFIPGMRWKLEGRKLTQWEPDVPDSEITPTTPLGGAHVFTIVSIDSEKLVLETSDGRRFVTYRLHGDLETERETAATRAKNDTEVENRAHPVGKTPASSSTTWIHRTHALNEITDSWTTNTLTLNGQTFTYVQSGTSTFRDGVVRPTGVPRNVRSFSNSFRYLGDVVENSPTKVRIKIKKCEFLRHLPRWANVGNKTEQHTANYVGATWTLKRDGANLVDAEDPSTVLKPR